MTNKELIKILKRFDKAAIIYVDGQENFLPQFYLTKEGHWVIELNSAKTLDETQKD